jgi:hypothetical protein
LRDVEAPTFSDIGLTDGGKVVSPMRRPLFTTRKVHDTHFCSRLGRPQAIVWMEELDTLKKSTSSGIRTGNLPSCSIVSQPNALPRAATEVKFVNSGETDNHLLT